MKNDLQNTKTTTTNHQAAAKTANVRVRSGVKAGPGTGSQGGVWLNHNQAKTVRVRSGVKAGGIKFNHNQAKTVRVRSGVKAGGFTLNHNQTVAR